ncbi:MAG: hypothetical protein PWR12_2096 [Eubacteriaceae bacterium]|nr:hypothetical protein [Eubacteriaceae bacterium]MDK2961865.1 hypothetical protein [Eubacteriaceae bacterium]MDN5289897.1 hypothetical protein [Anaerophaga sp.]
MSFNSLYGQDPPEDKQPECPVCGYECEKIYYSLHGDLIGCENCIDYVDAWEWADEEEKTAKAEIGDRQYDKWRDKRCS